jgi:hypothetical protein
MSRLELIRTGAILGFMAAATAFSGASHAAEVTFTEATVDSAFGGPAGVYAADVDGDGHKDILGAGSDDSDIAWWRNSGTYPVTWTKQTVADAFGGAIFVYAEDVDGDLDTDILGAAWNRGQIAWWSNGGQDPIVWTKQIIASGYTQAHEVYACDLDKDGDIDVLGASAGLGRIAWWRNDGGDPIAWTEQTIDSVCPGARSVRTADFDGDGDIDVVAAALVSNEVSWYRNDGGDPVVWSEFTIDASFGGSHMVRIADINGDNDPDVVATAYSIDQIAWYENQGGSPVAWAKHVVTSDLDGAVTGYPADIDNDGDIDVLGTGQPSGDVIWYENLGGEPPAWAPHNVDPDFAGAWPACADDIDGDGGTDLVVGGADADRIKWWHNEYGAGILNRGGDDLPEMAAPRLIGNQPNPFGPVTLINFELGRASHVRLIVYDIFGRHVKTLIDGPVEAGQHSVEWDGTYANGSTAPPGIYFLRIASGSLSDARPVTLLR